MKSWLVSIGNWRLVVEAETALEAMTKFWTEWDDVDLDEVPDANFEWMSAIEVIGDELFMRTEDAIKASGRHLAAIERGRAAGVEGPGTAQALQPEAACAQDLQMLLRDAVARSVEQCPGGNGCDCCRSGCDCGCRDSCPRFLTMIRESIGGGA